MSLLLVFSSFSTETALVKHWISHAPNQLICEMWSPNQFDITNLNEMRVQSHLRLIRSKMRLKHNTVQHDIWFCRIKCIFYIISRRHLWTYDSFPKAPTRKFAATSSTTHYKIGTSVQTHVPSLSNVHSRKVPTACLARKALQILFI